MRDIFNMDLKRRQLDVMALLCMAVGNQILACLLFYARLFLEGTWQLQ